MSVFVDYQYPLVPSLLSIMPSYNYYNINDPSNNVVNDDPNLRKQITEYFYNKIVKSWSLYHYKNLLDLIVIENNKPTLIKNLNNIDKNVNNNEEKNKYLLSKYLTKKILYELLKEFVVKQNLNWWDVKLNQYELRTFIHKKVKKMMEKNIYKHSNKNIDSKN